MQFNISTQEFQRLINKCFPVVAKKPAIPILSNILLEAKNDEIILTATDLTVSMRCFGEAKVQQEGKIALNARKLFSLVRELSADQVQIVVNQDNRVDIRSGTSRFRLYGMDGHEFPSLPDMSMAKPLAIPCKQLADIFSMTSFAIARSEARYELTGLHMEIDEGAVTFTATDGKRIARVKMNVKGFDEAFSGSYIIPLKAVEDVSKSVQVEGEITLYLLDDKMGFETENCLVITKLLAVNYPDVSRVLPESFSVNCPLHREELQQLLKQVVLFTPEETSAVQFSFSKGDLKISANKSGVGEGEVNMPVNYDGEVINVSINGSHFLDYLNHTEKEIVEMHLLDSYNAVVVQEANNDNEEEAPSMETFHVLIPMSNP